MAFESLSDKFQAIFSGLKKKGKLKEADVDAAMREVKMALLEADVNFKVVKNFVADVKQRAIGNEVMESLTPGQQVIKIVNEEMTKLMADEEQDKRLQFSPQPPTIYMMVGLQGAGKTTSSAKIAGLLKKKNKKPLLVACDIYRPAAIKQLQVVGQQLDIPVFSMGNNSPLNIAKAALEHAKKNNNDVVILDTAGRLHIDQDMMGELQELKQDINPFQILLVVDSMTGQDAVNVAQSFNQQLEIDGIILTKLDGDTRGGAALSVKAVTGKPIKFACVGEKLTDVEEFHADRMASRILGMGDILTLIEKAEANINQAKAKEMEQKLFKAEFTFDDFLEQMQQIKKMGSLKDLMAMIPGMGSQMKNVTLDDKELDKVEAIIYSMTKQERSNPDIINMSRKLRIAKGSGNDIATINRFMKQFNQSKKMMKQMGGMMKGKKGKNPMFKLPF